MGGTQTGVVKSHGFVTRVLSLIVSSSNQMDQRLRVMVAQKRSFFVK